MGVTDFRMAVDVPDHGRGCRDSSDADRSWVERNIGQVKGFALVCASQILRAASDTGNAAVGRGRATGWDGIDIGAGGGTEGGESCLAEGVVCLDSDLFACISPHQVDGIACGGGLYVVNEASSLHNGQIHVVRRGLSGLARSHVASIGTRAVLPVRKVLGRCEEGAVRSER